MKKIIGFYILILLGIISCESEGPTPIPSPLIGTWDIVKLEANGQETDVDNSSTINFRADSTFTISLPDIPDLPGSGTWDDNTLALDGDDETMSIQMDADNLSMELTYIRENFKAENVTYKIYCEKN